ncbi:MAG TPA: histidine phosphatase family protein, partial [Gemmatimonadaceae bacterium]|nr:histidine phosphatase family protein [Gemmatimonadaceae bacterium]
GAAIDGLRDDASWGHFNRYRSGARAPEGELALEAQARVIAALTRLGEMHGSETIVAVSHADIIKSVLGHALGVPLDLQHRMEIMPASVSVVELHVWGARVLSMNERVPQ